MMPLMGWKQPKSNGHNFNTESGIATANVFKKRNNPDFCRIIVNDDKGYEIINEGFRGMGIKKERNTILL